MHASGTVSSDGVDRPTEQSLASLLLDRATHGLRPRHGGAVHRYGVQDNAQVLVPRAEPHTNFNSSIDSSLRGSDSTAAGQISCPFRVESRSSGKALIASDGSSHRAKPVTRSLPMRTGTCAFGIFAQYPKEIPKHLISRERRGYSPSEQLSLRQLFSTQGSAHPSRVHQWMDQALCVLY